MTRRNYCSRISPKTQLKTIIVYALLKGLTLYPLNAKLCTLNKNPITLIYNNPQKLLLAKLL